MDFYLCNGKVKKCKKSECYRNGGECRHTTWEKNRKKMDGTQMIIVGEDRWEMDAEAIKKLISNLTKERNVGRC